MVSFTFFLMGSKVLAFWAVLMSTFMSPTASIPSVLASSLITVSGTEPAISWIRVGVIGVGGSVEDETRDADCK